MGEADRLMGIGQFAEKTHLSVHQLRHYHAAGLLVPAHVDQESGYRYYSSPQIEVAGLIALLRSLDMPLTEIRSLLTRHSRTIPMTVLEHHRGRLEARFRDAERRLKELDDLLARRDASMVAVPPEDLLPVAVTAVRLHAPSQQHAVVLRADDLGRDVPIWIGPPEANAVSMWLSGQLPERPTTHDLLARLVSESGLSVRSVAIWLDREQPTLFKASISCDNPVREIDSRPSDAINLALRIGAPVMMSRTTIESCGVGPDHETDLQKGTVYELRAADGGSVGRAEAFTEPKAGDCVYVQQVLSITEVREDAELVVNEIADRTRRIIGPAPITAAAPRPGP